MPKEYKVCQNYSVLSAWPRGNPFQQESRSKHTNYKKIGSMDDGSIRTRKVLIYINFQQPSRVVNSVNELY